MRLFEKQIMLQILDTLWKEHLATMDHLRQGIFLRSYGGRNPRQEYKREAFALFQDLLSNFQFEVVKMLSQVNIRQQDEVAAIERRRQQEAGTGAHELSASKRIRPRRRGGAANAGFAAPRTGGPGTGPAARAWAGAGAIAAAAFHPGCAEGGTQRALSMRFRQEIQVLLWPHPLKAACRRRP